MAKFNNLYVNEHVPRMGNVISRLISECALKVMGWKITGSLPNENKVIFIGAPHTSNWDFLIALSAMQAIGLRCSWMMKKQGFFWPLGGIFRKMGGIPIDREGKNDIAYQMKDWFRTRDKVYLGVMPAGTRSKVRAFKRGYLRIAYAAKVPVFIVGIDARNKEIHLDRLWPLTGDIHKDNRAIKDYYDANYKGIRQQP